MIRKIFFRMIFLLMIIKDDDFETERGSIYSCNQRGCASKSAIFREIILI